MTRPDLTASQRWGSAFAWTVLSQLVLGGTRVALSIIIGRSLGKELLGEFSALLSVATFLVMFWPQATGVAAAKYVATAASNDQRRAFATLAASSSLRAGIPLGVVSTVWSHFVFDVPPETSACVGALVVVLSTSAAVRGIRNGLGRLSSATVADSVGSVVALLLMAWIVIAGLESLILLPIVISFLPALLTGWPRRRATAHASDRKSFVSFTGWTSGHILAASSLLPLLTILTALSTSPTELGDFAAAASFATPLFLLSLAARSALEPFVAASYSASGESAGLGLVDALFRAMVMVFVPLVGVGVLWSEPLLTRLYDPTYSPAAPIFGVLLFAVGVNSLNAAHVWLSSTVADGPRSLAWSNTAGLLVGLATAVLVIPVWGALGAGVGMLVGALVSTCATTALVWRRHRPRWGGIVTRTLCGTGILAAALVVPDPSFPIRLGITLCFVVACCVLALPDLRTVRALVGLARPVS